MENKKLLVLDTSFSYEAIIERGLETSVTCRDLEGFFEHVWSVHPFASLVTSSEWGEPLGKSVVYEVTKAHTFIEGKIGRTRLLKNFPTLNFILAQIEIFIVLYRIIRIKKISIIRVGDPLYLGILGYVLSKLTCIPFVVRVGANNEKIRRTSGRSMMPRLFRSMRLERSIEKFVFSRADLVAGANEDNLQFAIDFGANKDKCTLFRYGNLLDNIHFTNPAQRSVADEVVTESPFLLCIARLEVVKKVDDVIRALAEVRKNGYIVRALLVGDGRERENLECLAKELGVSRYVVFLGNRGQQWLASTIPHASVVISPHTGRALAEAALGAAPIVAYDVDWQAEVISTGITGELVSYGDWQALSSSTIRLLSDRGYAKQVGENVRRKLVKMMDPHMLNEHERSQYAKLID